MIFDYGFLCAAAVLGGGRGGEVPFYVGGTGHEGDVVEVNDLYSVSRSNSILVAAYTLSPRSNFGYIGVSIDMRYMRRPSHTLLFFGTRNYVSLLESLSIEPDMRL